MISGEDTIVAAGSPAGRSPRGLLRFTGPRTGVILAALTGGQANGKVKDPRLLPRMLAPCRLKLPGGAVGSAGVHELPVLCAFFVGPASYTGQDMAELQCPGHPALLERIIRCVRRLGVRLAEPGEFTWRAFVAGKLDLTQAEGIAATIAATSDDQLHAAGFLRRGELGRFAAQLVDALAEQLARVEAGIDFVDQEDVVAIAPDNLDANLAGIERRLLNLLSRSRSWGGLEALPRVVLAGAPSTGKSTLFNALLGRQRAVIATTAGTTRDVLMEPLRLETSTGQSVEVMLVDIAGLDAPGSPLDGQIQQVACSAIDRADVILHVHDGLGGEAGYRLPDLPVIRVRTKADLAPSDATNRDVVVSGRTGAGLGRLRRLLASRLADRAVSVAADTLALQPRHETALHAAADCLGDVRRRLEAQRGRRDLGDSELIAATLRAALDELAGLGGQMTPDDIIGRVFATFCVGK